MKEEAKEKIIAAATELFTSKGYEKTKIDDIAKNAGLTRMMVYYYFESKQEILSTIIKNLFKEAFKKIETTDIDLLVPNQFMGRINEVLSDKKEVVAFLMGEVLKGNMNDLTVFQFLKEFYDKIIDIFQKKKKLTLKDRNEIYINLLFFHSIPLLTFISLKDRVTMELNIESNRLEKVFFDRFLSLLKQTIDLSLKI
ncbi:MAG: TetR/AcrR family transcriptional regulator [Brevinematia bacterium]